MIICDKCDEEFEVLEGLQSTLLDRTFNLCSDCGKEFRAWLSIKESCKDTKLVGIMKKYPPWLDGEK